MLRHTGPGCSVGGPPLALAGTPGRRALGSLEFQPKQKALQLPSFVPRLTCVPLLFAENGQARTGFPTPTGKHAPRSAVGHDTMDRAQRRNSLSVFPRYSRSPSLKLYRRNQGSFVGARVSVTEEAKLRSCSHILAPMNAAARLRRQDVVINYERRRNRPNQNPKTTNGIGRASHRIASQRVLT